MATKTDKTDDKKAADERDDDRVIPRDEESDEPEEIFTDLRDNRANVEVPDDAQDALDELAADLGVKEDDDEVADPDADPDDAADPDGEGKTDEDDAAALEAQATARTETFRKELFERKKSTLQLIAAQAETLDVKEVNAKTLKASAERIIAGYTDRMKALKEAGDTDGEIALQQEGLDARDTLKTATATLEQIAKDRPVLLDKLKQTGWNGKAFDETDADKTEIAKLSGKTTQAETAKPSKNSAAFVKANAWMSDPKYAGQRTLLLAMDAALRAEGKIDVDDPKYFPTLTQRFNRVPKEAGGLPGLIKDIGGKPVATGTRERGRGRGGAMPSGGLGTVSDDDGEARGGKVTLTSLDLRTMRSFGMDPNSKKDRTAFLSEKRADARQSAGRA